MIDKLDLRVPRNAPFTPSFQRLYRTLQEMERRPIRAAKLYEYAGDLREYGHNLRLNLYCRMDKVGNHKLELIDVGMMTRTDIMREVVRVFEVDPFELEIQRIDFAVDIPGVPLNWFREAVQVSRKRFRSAITGDRQYCEMGNRGIQTLYFGKRPNLFRIYDKRAEYLHQFQNAVRKLPKDTEPRTFENVMGFTYPEWQLTRVERQLGGRIPDALRTFGNVCDERFAFDPFAPLRVLNQPMPSERDPGDTFETFCTGCYLQVIAKRDGMSGVKNFLREHSNGNTAWALKKYARFLGTESPGIDSDSIRDRFRASLDAQMGRVVAL